MRYTIRLTVMSADGGNVTDVERNWVDFDYVKKSAQSLVDIATVNFNHPFVGRGLVKVTGVVLDENNQEVFSTEKHPTL